MNEDIFLFIGGASASLITFLVILFFRHLLRKGKQIRRSAFVTTVTLLMAICGLVIVLVLDSGILPMVVLTLSMGVMGAGIFSDSESSSL
jgi:hypothetical protein